MTRNSASGPVRRGAAASLYEQVASDLRSRIATSAAGERVPTEQELMHTYSVSRTTIRRAMDQLLAEGLVVRRAGMGTFIRERPLAHRISPANPFLGDLFTSGASIEIAVDEFRWLATEEMAQEPLAGYGAGGWIRVRRSYKRDGRPFGVSVFDIPEPVAGGLRKRDVEGGGSYELLGGLGVALGTVTYRISCEPAADRVAHQLGLAPGELCLKVARNIHDAEGEICMLATLHLPATMVEFVFDAPASADGDSVRALPLN